MHDTAAAPRSRRSLLAAALGGGAALAAHALGRPAPARGSDPNDVVLGATNYATSTTTIQMNSDAVGFKVDSSTRAGDALIAYAGEGIGVFGQTTLGASDVSGVYGFASSDQIGVTGKAYDGGTGVVGLSGNGTATTPANPPKTGVFGHAVQDSGSRGVTGQTTAGRGVSGLATSGRGVHGQATSGRGVHGYATSGIGGYFTATTGTALQAEGPVRFSSAGLATVGAGSGSVTVPAGVDLTTTSKVLCTLMGNPGGSTFLRRVAVNTSTNEFTIHLSAASTANVKVAWFVIS